MVSDNKEGSTSSRSEVLSFRTITSCALFFPLVVGVLSAFFLLGNGGCSTNASLFLSRGNHRRVSVFKVKIRSGSKFLLK